MDNRLRNTLLSLGFYQNEINEYEKVYMNAGKFTPAALQSYGYTYEQAKRLSYMNKAIRGDVRINSEDDMITHVKKMTGASRQDAKQYVYRQNLSNGYGAQNYTKEQLIKRLKETNGRMTKIGIQDLAVSNITTIPRVAVVSGIKESPYNIWNSNNYKGKNALYKVIDVTGQRITVETSKKPELKYGATKVIPGVLEIKGIKQNNKAIVAFDKKYCRLCNRYVIVASLKRPEFHLGMYEIICFEGTKVYVYATSIGIRESVSHRGGNQRVYAYGIFPQDAKNKLTNVAKGLYSNLYGVNVEYIDSNTSFSVIPKEVHDDINSEDSEVEF